MVTQTTKVCELQYRTRSIFTQPFGPTQKIVFNDTSQIVSIGHPGWRQNTEGDSGGPFYLKKDTQLVYPGSYTGPLFTGTFTCGTPSGFNYPWGGYTSPSNPELDAKGTTAISRVEPTKSYADVATFIGELRSDGIPRLRPEVMQVQTKRARAAGSDYLNVEFGWRPLVSDIQKMAYAVIHSHEILSNYRSHGSGQKIRRRFAFPTQSESWSGSFSNFLPIPTSVNQLGTGTAFAHRQQDMWFAGAFRYHVPVGDDFMNRLQYYRSSAQKLLGVDITPETVWNVSPWSWLVDWQTNVGDVLHNVSAMGRDGLVLQYGYMMCHTSFEESRSAKFGTAGFASISTRSQTKLRRPATPFGFGVDIAGLTARQSAILVALGLSRT